jgi:hypothetical protein
MLAPSLALAQNTANQTRPNFITFFDLQVGSTGAEIGISARVRNRLATGIFVKELYNNAFYNTDSDFLAGLKAKFYTNNSPISLYAGPTVGAHSFGDGLRPFAGINLGFDHYSGVVYFKNRTELRFGIDLQMGLDTNNKGFIGMGVSFGFGWSNTPVRQPSPRF